MGTHPFGSFLVGCAIVALLILGWAAIQGIGSAFGPQEWLVR